MKTEKQRGRGQISRNCPRLLLVPFGSFWFSVPNGINLRIRAAKNDKIGILDRCPVYLYPHFSGHCSLS